MTGLYSRFSWGEPTYHKNTARIRELSTVASICWYCGETIYHDKSRMKHIKFSRITHAKCSRQFRRNKHKRQGRYV